MRDEALNERDYGDLSGLNKDDARKRWGEQQVLVWRRSYDIAPPGARASRTPRRACSRTQVSHLAGREGGRDVLVVAHGNSIRALIMYLEELTAKQILEREVATGVPIVYRLTENGQVAERHDLVA